MNKINRRSFIQKASSLAIPVFIPASVFGANDRINLASIGTGRRGKRNIKMFAKLKECKVTAVCDVHKKEMIKAKKLVNRLYRSKDCETYEDFRELLEKKSIDAVCISTPDHWHGITAIEASKTGKGIYCEKPLVNNIREGRALVEACKNNNTILQTGTNERSTSSIRYACELVRNARIGKLNKIIINLPTVEKHHLSVWNDSGENITLPPPEQLDWDFWLGPTPAVPYNKKIYKLWRFILTYGGGEMTDRGAHVIDLAQLGADKDLTMPAEYRAKGKTPPNSKLFNTYFNFNFEAVYKDGLKMIGTSDKPRGLKFIGDKGWIFIHIHGGKLEASDPKLLKEKIGPDEIHLGRSPGHYKNFLDSFRQKNEPVAPVYAGYHTAIICHLLNISMRLNGANLKWDQTKEQITNNKTANKMIDSSMRPPWKI